MFESLNTFFEHPFFSVLAGAVVTWLFAWFYYKKAGDELKEEASRLHCTTEIILRWLETHGENVSVIRQPDGTPSGLNHYLSIAESISVTDSVSAEIIRSHRE